MFYYFYKIRFNNSFFTSSLLLAMLLLIQPALTLAESSHSSEAPSITEVTTDSVAIHIMGSNLDKYKHLKVMLGATDLALIGVYASGIDAYLPVGLADGDYRITLYSTEDDKVKRIISYDFTLGATGPVGSAGPQGSVGVTGPMGPQGSIGLTGPKGATGSKGSDGMIGPMGPVGPQGAQGVAGAKGPAGPKGSTGAQGPIGKTGPQGQGFTCVNGDLLGCYTAPSGVSTLNVGTCRSGTRICAGGVFGTCTGEVKPVTEICGDRIDNNCNGSVDEGCAPPPSPCVDADADGYFGITAICVTGNDCNDSDPAVNPGAVEVCNGIDDNCDGQVDEGGVCGLSSYSNCSVAAGGSMCASRVCIQLSPTSDAGVCR